MKQAALIAAAAILFATVTASAQPQPLTPPTAPPDWITAANKPCKLWNPEPQPNESVTWSGDCKDGFATGKGTLRWMLNGKPDAEFDGVYLNGKRNGPGILTLPDGQKIPGFWINDEPLRSGRGDTI